jgi:hypothetical protein
VKPYIAQRKTITHHDIQDQTYSERNREQRMWVLEKAFTSRIGGGSVMSSPRHRKIWRDAGLCVPCARPKNNSRLRRDAFGKKKNAHGSRILRDGGRPGISVRCAANSGREGRPEMLQMRKGSGSPLSMNQAQKKPLKGLCRWRETKRSPPSATLSKLR